MCGIFGAVKQKRGAVISAGAIRSLALANRARGTDSLGLFASDYASLKSAQDPIDALAQKSFRKFIDRECNRSWFISGHTRQATHGTVSNKNAHPFRYAVKQDVIGSHNGIVQAPIHFDVDSEYLLARLAEYGSENYQEALEQVSGYWALSWYDGKCLWLQAHNNEIAWGESLDVFYFSSEGSHLRACGIIPKGKLSDGQTLRFFPGGTYTRPKKFKGKKSYSFGYYSTKSKDGVYQNYTQWWDESRGIKTYKPTEVTTPEVPQSTESTIDTELESESLKTDRGLDGARRLEIEAESIFATENRDWGDKLAKDNHYRDLQEFKDLNGYVDDYSAMMALEDKSFQVEHGAPRGSLDLWDDT